MKKFLYLPMAIFMAMGFAACGDDKDANEPNDPNQEPGSENVDPNVGKEALTPTQTKQYLNETAAILADKFNPSQQDALLTLASNFCDKYADLDMPEEYENLDGAQKAPIAKTMAIISRSLDSNYTGLSRATESYNYAFGDLTGIFEAKGDQWVKTGNSNDIIFKWTCNGDACEAKASASKNTWTAEFEIEDYDWWDEVSTTEKYTIAVPEQIALTITRAGNPLFTCVSEVKFNKSGHTLTASQNVVAMNVIVNSQLTANDSQINEVCNVAVNDEVILSANAIVNGSHLCDQDYLTDLIDEEGDIDKVLSNATGEANLLGRIQAKINLKNISKLASALDNWYEYGWEYTKEEAKKEAQKDAQTFAQYFDCDIYYSGTSVRQAYLDWSIADDEWGNTYGEWYIEPRIVFDCDGTSYSIEGYFDENGFSSTIDTYEDLSRKYERYW